MTMASMVRWQTISLMPVPEETMREINAQVPYIFDMLTFTDQYNERDDTWFGEHVEEFVEMGVGFVFHGTTIPY